MSSMAGLVGPAIVEERGAGGCGGFSDRSVGLNSGGARTTPLLLYLSSSEVRAHLLQPCRKTSDLSYGD